MKKPMINECPCCGVDIEINIDAMRTVEPICKSAVNVNGKLIRYDLHWRCLICCCEWLDGQQFESGASNKQ